MATGDIIPHHLSAIRHGPPGSPSQPLSKTFRIGIFIATSPFYSGGRYFLWQYAWACAQLGAEVYIITTLEPKWQSDFPTSKNINVVIQPKNSIPPDLDLVVLDGKSSTGRVGIEYANRTGTPVFSFSFETPNWVEQFAPEIAKKVPSVKEFYDASSLCVPISLEGERTFKEWYPRPIQTHVLYPRINTFASPRRPGGLPKNRDFMLWSGRASPYKGAKDAWEAVSSFDGVLDFVTVGAAMKEKGNALHKIWNLGRCSDSEKFGAMEEAKAVIQPSKFEGFGLVPGEALSVGTPCIVYDLPVLREVYGNSLIYVRHGDKKELAAAVAKAATQEKPKINKFDFRHRFGIESMPKDVARIPMHGFGSRTTTAVMIAYYGPTIHEAIEAIYSHVECIRIAYGPIELWKNFPSDGTLQRIRDFPDPQKKIFVEDRPLWKDKREMREWTTQKIDTSHVMVVDADEIWTGFPAWKSAEIDFGSPRWVHFWHDLDHCVVNPSGWGMSRWGEAISPFGTAAPHYRWSWWRPSYRWTSHCIAADRMARPICSEITNKGSALRVPGAVIWHLGHVLDRKLMKAKHQFYLDRDGNDPKRRKRMEIWHNWNGKLGDCGDGVIKQVNFEVPEIVRRAYNKINAPALALAAAGG